MSVKIEEIKEEVSAAEEPIANSKAEQVEPIAVTPKKLLRKTEKAKKYYFLR